MSRLLSSVICALLLAGFTSAAPAAISSDLSSAVAGATAVLSVVSVPNVVSTASAEAATPTVPYASDNANRLAWNPDAEVESASQVQPVRGELGGSILGPVNVALQQQNPDLLAPPTTDHGSV